MAVNFVLLVDDNDTDNFINQRIIQLTGFAERIEVRNSGKKALEYLEAHKDSPDDLPDLIFLDINMPIVDGFVFLHEVESFPDTVKNKCRVAILSSSDNKRAIDRIVDNELVIKFITKPLTEEALGEINTIMAQA